MSNRPFPSSPEPLYQNEVKCSALDMKMIFHSHTNKTHFHKKGCALCLVLKVRVSGTRKRLIGWQVIPVVMDQDIFNSPRCSRAPLKRGIMECKLFWEDGERLHVAPSPCDTR